MPSLKLRRRKGKKAELPKRKKRKGLKRRNQPDPPRQKIEDVLPKKGGVVYKLNLRVFGGLINYTLKKCEVTKMGKVQATVKYNSDFENSGVEYVDNVGIKDFGELVDSKMWRTTYNVWEKVIYLTDISQLENAKEMLRKNALGFFSEAAAVCECAVSGLRKPNLIREDRHGF